MPKQNLKLINFIKEQGTRVINSSPQEEESLKEVIVSTIDKMVKEDNVDLASIDKDGKTALMHAAELGNFIAVDHLCKWNVINIKNNYPNVNAESKEGISALGYSVRYKDMVEEFKCEEETPEDKSSVSNALVLGRKRFIVERLIYNKAIYNQSKDDEVIFPVLELASEAGNLRFLQKYFNNGKNFLKKPYHQNIYPKAIRGGYLILEFWENNLGGYCIEIDFEKIYGPVVINLTVEAIKTNDIRIIEKFMKLRVVNHVDETIMSAAITSPGVDILEYMLSFGNSNKKGEIINLHSAYLLKMVELKSDLGKIKFVVELAKKASIRANDYEAKRIESAFSVAWHKGYIDIVKEILWLQPSSRRSNSLPVVSDKFVSVIKKTGENERVTNFIMAFRQAEDFKNNPNLDFNKVCTDDLACIPSYFEFDHDIQEALEESVRQEIKKRTMNEEKAVETSSAPSAPPIEDLPPAYNSEEKPESSANYDPKYFSSVSTFSLFQHSMSDTAAARKHKEYFISLIKGSVENLRLLATQNPNMAEDIEKEIQQALAMPVKDASDEQKVESIGVPCQRKLQNGFPPARE